MPHVHIKTKRGGPWHKVFVLMSEERLSNFIDTKLKGKKTPQKVYLTLVTRKTVPQTVWGAKTSTTEWEIV